MIISTLRLAIPRYYTIAILQTASKSALLSASISIFHLQTSIANSDTLIHLLSITNCMK